MSWYTIISHRGVALQDAKQLELARVALGEHFAKAGCSAFEAARAAFDQDQPLMIADDGLSVIEDGRQESNGKWADAWRAINGVVAGALSLREADVEVELQFEKPPRRTGPLDSSTARRLFIGLMAGAATQAEISSYQLQWDWTNVARLVPPERFHVTLLFLGRVDQKDEERLRLTLRDVPMTPFSLHFESGSLLGDDFAVLKVMHNDALNGLRENLLAKVRDLGVSVDTKPWVPHLTLARQAAGCKPPNRQVPFMQMTARHFSLVCSRPERAQSYEVIESWAGAHN